MICNHTHTQFIETPFEELDGRHRVLVQQICEDCGFIIWEAFEDVDDGDTTLS